MMRLAGVGLAAALAAGAWTQVPDARANGAQVVVNEVVVATLRTSRGAQTPALRAQTAAATLLTASSPSQVEVRPPAEPSVDWLVTLGPQRVLTVTPEEARAANQSQQALAQRWAEGIQKALGLPPLQVDRTSLLLPPDKPGGVALVGSQARKAQILLTQGGIVGVTRTLGRLAVRPQGLGQIMLTIRGTSAELQVPVTVQPYAISLPLTVEARVLGEPAQPSTVTSAIRAALGRVEVKGDGRLTVRRLPESSLASGESRTVQVAVRAEGAGTFPVEGEISVRVRNLGLMPRNESQLWYSNAPENVDGPQRIYWGKLLAGETIRLLTHHKNVTSRDLDVLFYLANPGSAPVSLGLTMGDSRPDLNPTLAGYIAGDAFMRSWMTRSGEMITIAPGQAVPLIIRRTKPEETMSGLSVLAHKTPGGSPLILVGEALAPGALPLAWNPGGAFPAPWTKLPSVATLDEGFSLDGRPKQVYSPPVREETFTNEAGRFTFIRIGEKAIQAKVDDSYETLLGNFGVHYRVAGTIRNNGTLNQNVEVVFEASAGYSGALFVVNGQYVPARILQAKQIVRLWTKSIPPGGSERVVVQTIPLSGAHYPATLIIRPVDSIR